jgi:hypothetical protein
MHALGLHKRYRVCVSLLLSHSYDYLLSNKNQLQCNTYALRPKKLNAVFIFKSIR